MHQNLDTAAAVEFTAVPSGQGRRRTILQVYPRRTRRCKLPFSKPEPTSTYDPNKKVKFNKELYHNGKDGNGVFEGGLYKGRDAFYWCSGDDPCEFYYFEQGTPDLPDKNGYKLWKASCDKDGCPGYYKVYAEDCKPSDYTGYDDKTKAKCTLNFYCMISNTDDMGMDC